MRRFFLYVFFISPIFLFCTISQELVLQQLSEELEKVEKINHKLLLEEATDAESKSKFVQLVIEKNASIQSMQNALIEKLLINIKIDNSILNKVRNLLEISKQVQNSLDQIWIELYKKEMESLSSIIRSSKSNFDKAPYRNSARKKKFSLLE